MLISVLFDKIIWNEESAKGWLNKHGIHPIKDAHITSNFIRYRINPPIKTDKYITKKLNNGVSFVISYK